MAFRQSGSVVTLANPALQVDEYFGRFAPIWREFVDEWKKETTQLPLYVVLGDLARHIASLYQEDAEAELQEIFSVVETRHLEGDAYVREAAPLKA